MSNSIAKIAVVAFAVVGLFTAGLLGTLGARGQLNRDGLSSMFGGKEPAKDVDALHATLGANGAMDPAAREAQDTRISELLAGTALPRIELPSPFSTEQSAELFEELEATRTELASRLAGAKERESQLELVRSDLNRRWDELDRREQELEEQSKAIVAERQELAGRSVMLEEVELDNLSAFARKIEKMKAQAAAELLQQKEPAEAAKILSFVSDREAGKIMENLPPEFLAKVAEKAIGIIRPTTVTGPQDGK